ncbi:MAG: hypothetical protein ACTHZ5_15975 [Micrococcaceae bacterium]
MTHRSDAEASIIATRDTLADTILRKPTTLDVAMVNASRAQAIATAGVAQAVLALVDAITEERQR